MTSGLTWLGRRPRVWIDLFLSLVEQLALFLFLTWLIVWLLVAVPRVVSRQKLAGSFRLAWDAALPFGGLVAIIVIGRALLEWSVR